MSTPLRITVAGTGGTIAATGASATETVEYRVTASIDALVGGLGLEGTTVSTRQIVNVDSSEIGNALLLRIAHSVAEILADPQVDAMVLTHGTDTLEETAYFLHLVLKTEKPVVIVGAMRPASALGADGPANLLTALRVAASPLVRGLGVLVVSDGAIISARDLTKTTTAAIGALGTRLAGPLGEVSGDEVLIWHRPALCHTMTSGFDIAGISDLPQVDILYDHQDARAALYDAAIAGGAQGLVVAAYGNGSLSPAAIEGAALAAATGIPFVRASRTGAGVVARKQTDAALGMVSALSLNPQKARILLLCALLQGQKGPALQQVFASY